MTGDLFGILLVILPSVLLEKYCNSSGIGGSSQCPPNRPYCTPVGCVFECPGDTYVNGTACVVACGEWYTTPSKHCVPTCSQEEFIRENPKLIGRDFYLEKECTSSCKRSEFVFNGTCVQVCPVDFKFVINQNCSNRCPSDYPFMKNESRNGLLHHICQTSCLPYFLEESYCTEECSADKVLSDYSCIDICPETHKLVYQRQCLKNCYNNLFEENDTCVRSCSTFYPFLYGRKCLDLCPDDAPFYCTGECLKKQTVRGELGICMSVCPLSFPLMDNVTCVANCPFKVLNHLCRSECPEEFSYSRFVTQCIDDVCSEIYSYWLCIKECDQNDFIMLDKKQCVEICPKETFIYNSTCLKSCPSDYSYMKNRSVSYTTTTYSYHKSYYLSYYAKQVIRQDEERLHCYRECSDTDLQLNDTCFDVCPELFDEKPLYLFNESCVSKCPETHPFIEKNYKAEQCFYTCRTVKAFYECKESCSNGKLIKDNYRCVEFCPDNLFVFKNACVDSCPPQTVPQNYMQQYSNWEKNVYWSNYYMETQVAHSRKCVNVCENSVLSDNICIDHCTFENRYVTNHVCHNRTCSGKLQYNSSFGIECLYICPNNTFRHEDVCLHICPNGLVIHENECKVDCPFSAPNTYNKWSSFYEWTFSAQREWRYSLINGNTKYCCEKCPENEGYLFNKSCTFSCPSSFNYILEGECVSKCADNHVMQQTSEGIHCLVRCPQNKPIAPNRFCVDVCPIEAKYNYEGECVSKCPPVKPFGVNENEYGVYFKQDIFNCKSECENDMVFKLDEEICIFTSACDNEYFVFAGQCLKECPEGYKWFLSCFHTTAVIICTSIIGLLVILITYRSHSLVREMMKFIRTVRHSLKVNDDTASEYVDIIKELCVVETRSDTVSENPMSQADADMILNPVQIFVNESYNVYAFEDDTGSSEIQ